MDIIENCAVIGFKINNHKIHSVLTEQGELVVGDAKVAAVVAGHASHVAEMAGFRLPLESVTLQALVSEPLKPVINTVIMDKEAASI